MIEGGTILLVNQGVLGPAPPQGNVDIGKIQF